LSTWTLLASIPNPGLIIYDRRERAQLLWVSHSYPFWIACLTFLDSMFPFSKVSLLSLDILHHKGGVFSQGELLIYLFVDVKRGRNKIYKNYFPTMSLNKNAFTLVIDPHTGLISNKNAFFTVIYILV
jgi:hypothetical protein